jgi:hypothetical protein
MSCKLPPSVELLLLLPLLLLPPPPPLLLLLPPLMLHVLGRIGIQPIKIELRSDPKQKATFFAASKTTSCKMMEGVTLG